MAEFHHLNAPWILLLNCLCYDATSISLSQVSYPDIKPDMLKGQFSEKYGAMPPEDLKRNPLFFEELLR